MKNPRWGRRALGVVVAGVMSGAVLSQAWAAAPAPDPAQRDELYRRLKVLAEALDVVQRNYVEAVSPDDLVYGAVEGIVARLDPHSSFMPPEMFRDMQVETEGSFGGLGIEVTLRDGRLTVVSPIEDTPASEAGIQAGDVIVEIEGNPVRDLGLGDAVKRLRGAIGTRVTIHIVRDGWPEPHPFTLTRAVVHVKSVKFHRVGDVGVIRIVQFQQRTHKEVEAALRALEEEGALQGLVLDLRNDPGGLLDQAVKVSDLFLTEGTVVSTRGRDPEQDVVYTARKGQDEPTCPIVVLVNRGTASASEIVAGALQDQGRAVVLGERSFGKGSVQTILPLSDGSGLRVTSALYYTPAGRSIQAKGIVPDIEVRAGEVVSKAPKPTTGHGLVREEDLDGHFDTPDEGAQGDKTKGKEPDLSGDRQMERAVQLLEGWAILHKAEAGVRPDVPQSDDGR